MSRLTKYERDQIRYRIVADIPAVDYDAKMQARVNEICNGLLPQQVRTMLKDPKLRQYVRSGTIWYCCLTLTTPGFGRNDDEVSSALKGDAQFLEFHRLRDEQKAAMETIRRKLRDNIDTVSTEKQFSDRFPELVKYLNKAPPAPDNLPATTDLVDSLKAAGVPLELTP